MKKILYLLFLTFFSIAYCQRITPEEAEKSTDPVVLAKFIKANPNHPKTEDLKQKLIKIVYANEGVPTESNAHSIKPSQIKKQVNNIRKEGNKEKNQQTADLLTHIFNNDPNTKEAYVQIINQSKCKLMVQIAGKDVYRLEVPAKGQNFILVNKGNYVLSTKVCDAPYTSSKKINQDIKISLNSK